MRTLWRFFFASIFLIISGCQSLPGHPKTILPASAGYLISGLDENQNFASNGMLIFDTRTFSKIQVIPLPHSSIEVARIAPDGNLWIGLSGGTNWDDDQVLVLNASGKKVVEFHACLDPAVGIWFYHANAFIVCRDTGFISSIVKVNTANYHVDKKIQLGIGNGQPFLAVSSGLSGSYLAVNGTTSGPQASLSYSVLIIVNLDTFNAAPEIEFGAATNIWSILPFHDNFYLLNAQGDKNEKREDVLIVDPQKNTLVESLTMDSPSPLWGVISSKVLYSFHDSEWNSIFTSPARSLCRTDLVTRVQNCIPLEDNFDAYDLALINGEPCLTHWGDEQSSGLYCMEDNKMELKIQYKDASLVAVK